MTKVKEENIEIEDNDREVSNSIGGVTIKLLDKTENRAAEFDEKMATLRGEKSGILTAFEQGGGSKKALKIAQIFCNMEDGTGRDVFRAMLEYMNHFGFFSQMDMFENLNGMGRFFKPAIQSIKDKAKPAAPQSIGEGQAAAFMSAH